jgi:hypothetical protein
MVRLRISLAALLLLAGAASAAQERNSPPQTPCRTYSYPSIPSLQICTELDPSELSPIGRTTIWRIRVKSGWKPVLVRLHNGSPGVVRLEGGNDQIRHMGCVRHHEIEVKVTAVGPGAPQLDAKPYDPSPQKESSSIAASLAVRLARIEAEFRERRGCLEGSPDYSAEAVEGLLDATESEILQALNYQELAALRDYVRKGFQDARAALEHSREKSTAGLPSVHAVLASLTLRRGSVLPAQSRGQGVSKTGTVPKQAADSVLDEILRKIHRLYVIARDDDMTTTLCITSDPESGAKFLMRPQSYNRKRETSTTSEITGLYRGLYIYSMSKGPKRKECLNPDRDPCGAIDLVDDTRPIFHCNLDDKACARLTGACHGSGS